MEYSALVRNAVFSCQPGEPIFTRAIADHLAGELMVPMREIRNLVAVNVSRLVDEGALVRFCSGIVYRPEKSAFGDLPMDPAILVARLYIGEGREVRGYVTGAAFLHAIGLSTWMPAETEVATNANVRDRKAKLLGVRLVKPRTAVTADNAAYLQVLDAIRDLDRLPVDCEDPDGLLAPYVRAHLDFATLVAIASAHYPASTVLRVAKLAERVAA